MPERVGSRGKTFRNLALLSLVAAVVGFAVPLPSDLNVGLIVFGILGTIGFRFAWLFAIRPSVPNEAPDLLAELGGDSFERDGLCFAPRLVIEDGLCWFNVYCQNRYSRPVEGKAFFVPMEGTSKTGPDDVPPVTVDVSCDGGEVAVVRVPYPLGKSWQGKVMIYDVYAAAEYPAGRGDLVRSGEGAPVGEPTSDMKEAFTNVALLALGTVGLFAVGVRTMSRPTASFEERLPQRVLDHVPPGIAATREVLWQLDLPTGGFPIAPAGEPGDNA